MPSFGLWMKNLTKLSAFVAWLIMGLRFSANVDVGPVFCSQSGNHP